MEKTISNRTLPAENTPNTSPPARNFRDSSWALGLLIGTVLLALVGCDRRPAAETTAKSHAKSRQDLLMGYDLLASTLSDESSLGTLDFFKKITFNGPNKEIDKMMKALSDASSRRASELTKLRHLAPDVSDKARAESPIGDAITSIARDIGESEMTSRNGGFDVRFVLLQAEATRMLSVIATAIARFDPNHKRKGWLKSLAIEYEGYRTDMTKYIGGKGGAQ
jgi:hypothetical protein